MIEWLSVTDYSSKTKISPSVVRNMCKEGTLKHEKSGKKIYILYNDESESTSVLKEINEKLTKLSQHLGLQL